MAGSGTRLDGAVATMNGEWYSVLSMGRLGLARPEKSFLRRREALEYRDHLNATWRLGKIEQVAVVVHPDYEAYVEWEEDDE